MFGIPVGYEFVQSGYTFYLLIFCFWGGAEVLKLETLPEKKTGAPLSQQVLSAVCRLPFAVCRWSFVLLLVEDGLFPGLAFFFSKTTQETMRRRATAPADPEISP